MPPSTSSLAAAATRSTSRRRSTSSGSMWLGGSSASFDWIRDWTLVCVAQQLLTLSVISPTGWAPCSGRCASMDARQRPIAGLPHAGATSTYFRVLHKA